jgi:MFS family permease
MFKFLTRTVWILSMVSLFADLASEMLYPIMPLFLEDIGMTAAGIGLLEGMASLVAGFGKAWFGSLSDRLGRRNVFVRLGYGLSALAKPVMGLFPMVGPVFVARLADRVGKGMRGGARDALLAEECSADNRGKVFGFHRSMDTIGAVLGAGLALLWLHYRPGELGALFLVAAGPGLLSVLIAMLLPKELSANPSKEPKRPFKGIFQFWNQAHPHYKRLLGAAMAFAILNSSDILLLLKAGESGLDAETVVGLYLFYNVIYVLASFPLGGLADKIGFKPVYVASIVIYGGCYVAIGLANAAWMYWVIFGIYGCFTAANEGIATAWLTKVIPKEAKATGIGLYSFLENFAKFVASPLLGLLWLSFTGVIAFQIVGYLALGLGIVFIFLLPNKTRK